MSLRKGLLKLSEYGLVHIDDDHTPTDGDMLFIQRYLKNPADADRCFVFKIKLCNNEADRDYECFDTSTLKAFADMYEGKTGMITVDGVTSYPRIYHTWIRTSENLKTQDGDAYCELWAKAFLIQDSKNAKAIQAIQSKKYDKVSVSCSIRRIVCNICGKESCWHVKGTLYGGKEIHRVLLDPTEVFEWVILESEKKATLKTKGRKVRYLKAATQQPNEPLSLDELREMRGKPVWCPDVNAYGIITMDKVGNWANKPFISYYYLRYEDDPCGTLCHEDIEARGYTIYRYKPI